MSVINTNVKSLVAQQAGVVNNRAMSKAMEQLSTGKRINGAADDAAGLAISNKMTSQIRGLNQAVRNANDGISMIQVAEGATTEVTNMLQRMRELAVQSINDTNTTGDRTAIRVEFSQLSKEIKRISDNTEWNTMKIANSDATSTVFQVGANSGQTVTVSFQDIMALSGLSTVVASAADATQVTSIGSAGGFDALSSATISTLDTAISRIDSYRSTLGATINRLTYAADNLSNVATNTAASRSRILDTDYAQVTTELARTQIIQQAATAMLAQANQQPQSVLSLLR
jgi:flagellin